MRSASAVQASGLGLICATLIPDREYPPRSRDTLDDNLLTNERRRTLEFVKSYTCIGTAAPVDNSIERTWVMRKLDEMMSTYGALTASLSITA